MQEEWPTFTPPHWSIIAPPLTHYYTREMREDWENPALGILLCADKNDAVVRYTLPAEQNQIFAAQYRLQLPPEAELAAELHREHAALLSRLAGTASHNSG